MSAVTQRLSFLHRYLTTCLLDAMGLGIGPGYFLPGVEDFIKSFQVGTTNISVK